MDNKCSWVVNTALAVLDTTGTYAPLIPQSYGLETNKTFNKISGSLHATRKTEIRAVLDENYGRKDAEKEVKVKKVFEELGIVGIYTDYEEWVYAKLMSEIEGIPEPERGRVALRREVFIKFIGKIYRRQK